MIFLKATGINGKRILKELERKGINMIEYLQELKIREGNSTRIIKNHLFKEKIMTDDEMEKKKAEFSKKIKDIYLTEKINIEIIENSITEI